MQELPSNEQEILQNYYKDKFHKYSFPRNEYLNAQFHPERLDIIYTLEKEYIPPELKLVKYAKPLDKRP